MREMKDSGIEWIGKIPVNWNKQKIKYTLTQRVKKNNPVICKNILSLTAKQGVVPYSEKEGAGGNKPKEDYSSYNLAYPNDIVMNSMNVISGSVGLSKYFGCVSPVYYMFYSDTNDIRFFNYIFQTSVFQRSLLGLGNGILMKESDNGKFNTVRMRIPMDKLGLEFLPVCSLSEQHKIADFLDQKCSEIDALTADIQTQIETLEEYKKSVITEAVTKGLDPNVEMKDSGIQWVDKIPANWKVNKIKYISNSIFKGQGIKKEDVDINGDIQCVRYGEIYSKYSNSFNQCFSFVNSNNLSRKQPFIKNGDIIFAITGELIEEIGKNILYTGELDCAVGGDIVVVRIDEDRRFINYALNSSYCQNQKSCNKFKLKVVHISAFEIGNILVLIPPLSIQKAISDFLDLKCAEINQTISEKQQQLDTLAEYKKSMIYEYVTGKKEVA